MAMPRKLKLMNVFLNGYSYQGVAKSVTLPKLTRKLENYRGAGMNGSAPVDLGLDDDALSMEWSLGGFPGFGYLGALRRNRCGCCADSFCRLLPA